MTFYTGIGSRATPPVVCTLMSALAGSLEHNGYTLRSGGAEGADLAFERGVEAPTKAEIYLPWKGFNGNKSKLSIDRMPDRIVMKAKEIAAAHHPAWHRCSDAARKFHTRNVMQMLGAELHLPSKFVVCWTKSGKAEGGTGLALRIAETHSIPIYNLKNPADREALYSNFDWSGSVVGDFLLAK
jgi:hypothetical protein